MAILVLRHLRLVDAPGKRGVRTRVRLTKTGRSIAEEARTMVQSD